MYFQLFDVWNVQASPEIFQLDDTETIVTKSDRNKQWCNAFGRTWIESTN